MTVKQLIQILGEYDGELEVYGFFDGGMGNGRIEVDQTKDPYDQTSIVGIFVLD